MQAPEIKKRLEALEHKLFRLVGIYEKLKEEYTNALLENEALKKKVTSQNEQLNHFQNKYKISKIVSEIVPNSEKAAELKNEIEGYIREIDKCITYLSKYT